MHCRLVKSVDFSHVISLVHFKISMVMWVNKERINISCFDFLPSYQNQLVSVYLSGKKSLISGTKNYLGQNNYSTKPNTPDFKTCNGWILTKSYEWYYLL